MFEEPVFQEPQIEFKHFTKFGMNLYKFQKESCVMIYTIKVGYVYYTCTTIETLLSYIQDLDGVLSGRMLFGWYNGLPGNRNVRHYL